MAFKSVRSLVRFTRSKGSSDEDEQQKLLKDWSQPKNQRSLTLESSSVGPNTESLCESASSVDSAEDNDRESYTQLEKPKK